MGDIGHTETAKFEVLIHRWWGRESEPKSFHDVNSLYVNWIDEHAGLAGKKMFDVSCGGDIPSEVTAQRGANVTSIDIGEVPFAVAHLHQPESGIAVDYRQVTTEQITEGISGQFDVVAYLEILEHMPDPTSVIRAYHRLVRPGGQVLLSAIDHNPRAYLFAVIGAEYTLQLLSHGAHDFCKFIRLSESGAQSCEAGLEVKNIIDLTYNPLTKHHRLVSDVGVSYMVQTQREA